MRLAIFLLGEHFLVNERLVPLVEECKVLHRGDNMSRHSPILLKLRVGDIPTKNKLQHSVPRKPAWHKADKEAICNYKTELQDKLEKMSLPASLSSFQ